jgi:hypothetical protein
MSQNKDLLSNITTAALTASEIIGDRILVGAPLTGSQLNISRNKQGGRLPG